MKYLVTQSEMKQYDKNTIERLQMPSIVLMERAALITVEWIRKIKGDAAFRVLVVSGCGNNGGDGIAVGRLLMLQGCMVDYVLLGSYEKCSAETSLQLEILARYGHKPYDRIPEGEYDIVIDAIFGIGLSRNVEGIYRETVCAINRLDSYVCAIDIPSGVHADSGKILGCAVQADLTVTYGFHKLGEFLYPGAGYCGKIICGQMGIDERSFFDRKPRWYTYTSTNDVKLPERKPNGNKGTFGKALVIAGSDNMCGAAIMAGKSVFRMGAGMVKIVTSQKNREILQQALPEAMITVYDADAWQNVETNQAAATGFKEEFRKALAWADCILIGPGIGTGKAAAWLLKQCLSESALPMVIDADGLNILAKELHSSEKKESFADRMFQPLNAEEGRQIILTPHMGEFARLYGCSIPQAAENITVYPQELADKLQCIVVCKDARTVVAYPGKEYCFLNTSGNAGMATAGSGDVLAGILTGLLAQGMEAAEAASAGVYLHGAAGDRAAAACGEHSMMATDIIEQMSALLRIIKE